VQSSTREDGGELEGGGMISLPEYPAIGWYVAPPRSTVLATLLANGLLPEIERSTNLRDAIEPDWFGVPWWYRSTFAVHGDDRTTIRLDGVIHKADLFVNGTLVANAGEIAGAYAVSEFDVTHLVTPGTNALAICVYPGSPLEDLSIGWVDWNRWPPDNNMGVWRDVVVERTGDLRLGAPVVTNELSLPSLDVAELSVSVEVANLSGRAVTAVVRGTLSGQRDAVDFGRQIALEAGQRTTVTFAARDDPALRFEHPEVWWPVGEGAQRMHDLRLTVSTDDVVSDQRATRFGIRSVTSHIEPGDGRRFVVNGRPLQILGGGWCPDLFLRHDAQRTAAELAYAVDLGLNTIRLEGKLENPEFFEMADEAGLMVLPGWECCNKWEGEKGEAGATWTEQDYIVAGRSMASEAVLLRNHPSVIGFLIGSDFAPPPRTASLYVDALERAGWSVPIVSAATAEGSEAAGPSGMKMTGPYAWVPPVYWYSKDSAHGGAVGFNSEAGAGGNIPRGPSLARMMSPAELESLWREPAATHFHAGPPSEFDNLAIFHRALAGRYGAPKSLRDFVRKAQLANYEAARAQFEAYASEASTDEPATGLVYWMFNSAWPSLNWQLYDWYLDPAGAYFGAKKANEPVHVQYSYGTGEVQVVNHGPATVGPFGIEVLVRDLSGAVVARHRRDVAGVPAREAASVGRFEVPDSVGRTYFLELRNGTSRNVYWLSTVPDVLDWEATTWQYTPTASFADLTGLENLALANVEGHIETSQAAGVTTFRIRLRNVSPAGTPAVGLHASVVTVGAGAPNGDLSSAGFGGSDGRSITPVAPVFWTDNDVTLFGGDELSIAAVCTPPPSAGVAIELDGFNLSRPVRWPAPNTASSPTAVP
jgi:exo-1,4-beta-D-glucosaminidase